MELSAKVERHHLKIIEGYALVRLSIVIFITDASKKAESIGKTPRKLHAAAYSRIEDIGIVRCVEVFSCLTGDEW